MNSGRLGQRWVLACAGAALLANFFGGFSLIVTGVFVVICLIGAALISWGEDPVGAGFPGYGAAADDCPTGSLTGPVDVVAPPGVDEDVAEHHPDDEAEDYPGDESDDEPLVVDPTAETEPSPA
jgi:hypothetical protein